MLSVWIRMEMEVVFGLFRRVYSGYAIGNHSITGSTDVSSSQTYVQQ